MEDDIITDTILNTILFYGELTKIKNVLLICGLFFNGHLAIRYRNSTTNFLVVYLYLQLIMYMAAFMEITINTRDYLLYSTGGNIINIFAIISILLLKLNINTTFITRLLYMTN